MSGHSSRRWQCSGHHLAARVALEIEAAWHGLLGPS